MRHKYDTRALALFKTPSGERGAAVTLLTEELGLVRAFAQGIFRPGAKLAPALVTFVESDVTLVRGAEVWRVTGAAPREQWFARMNGFVARERAARVCRLLTRLVVGEEPNSKLFPVVAGFFQTLSELPEDSHDAAELSAVLALLGALGLADEAHTPVAEAFSAESLAAIARDRSRYVAYANQGIAASGL